MMRRMDRRFAAAVARAEVRPAGGYLESRRTVMDTSGPLEKVGPEHALDGSSTLCGLGVERVHG